MFQFLNKEEIEFYRSSFETEVRVDGRSLTEFREYQMSNDFLLYPNALYGVKLVIPDSRNTFLFAVNANVCSEEDQEEDFIYKQEKFFKIEIKSASEGLNQDEKKNEDKVIKEMSDMLKKFLVKNINTEKMKIEDKFFWQVICDVFIIGQISLNEFDYLEKGIKQCLLKCEFPNVMVSKNNWTNELSYEIIQGSQNLFVIEDLPNLFIVGEYKGSLILDMNKEELESVDSFYIVAYDQKGKLTDMEKLDGLIINVNRLGKFISSMMSIGNELIQSRILV